MASSPAKATFRHDLPENHEWIGSVLFLLGKSEDIHLGMEGRRIASLIHEKPIKVRDPLGKLTILLQQLKKELEFKCGYVVPRNDILLGDGDTNRLSHLNKDLRQKVLQDNALDQDDREKLLAEIALFEASLGCARLSPDLLARFVNGVLKGATIAIAGALVQEAASALVGALLPLLGWHKVSR